MLSLMLDLETLDDVPEAAVTSACLIPFDDGRMYEFQELVDAATYLKLDTESQIADGRSFSEDCIQNFWMKQPKHVREAQLDPTPDDISASQFLDAIDEVCNQNGINIHSIAYCRGQSFDFPIITDMVRMYRPSLDYKVYPVGFWNQRDVRSVISGYVDDTKANKVPLPAGVLDGFELHNPVHDCARAILHLRYARAYARGEIDVPDEIDPLSLK